MIVSIPETLNFGLIFALHFTRSLLVLLFQSELRFILFPIAGITSIIKAALAWQRYAYDLDHRGQRSRLRLLHAVWDTIQAIGVSTAVIVGIAAHFMGLSAVVGPGIAITFSFLLGASVIFQASLTAHAGYKAWKAYQAWKHEPDESEFKSSLEKKYRELRANVIENLIGTSIVTLLCIGVTLAMVAGFPLVGGIIGVATCLAATAYTIYNLYKHKRDIKKTDEHGGLLEESPSFQHDSHETRKTSSQAYVLSTMPPRPDNDIGMKNRRDRSQSNPDNAYSGPALAETYDLTASDSQVSHYKIHKKTS